MKKSSKLLGICFTAFIALVGCSNNSGEKNADTNDAEHAKEEKATYEEFDTFDIDGVVSTIDLNFDEEGESLFWIDLDSRFSHTERRNVRLIDEKETITLDEEEYGLATSLLPSGKIYSDDSNSRGEEYHILKTYDVKNDVKKDYDLPESMFEHIFPILHPNATTINEDHSTYIHFQTDTDHDKETFLWNYETGDTKEIPLMQVIRDTQGEEDVDYPRLQLSSDMKKVFVLIDSIGIYEYDIESEEMKTLLEDESIVYPITYTSYVTADDRYIPYVDELIKVEDRPLAAELQMSLLDVTSKESIPLGIVNRIYTLKDGNVMLLKEDGLYYYDIEKEEETEVYPINLEDHEELKDFSISENGETFVMIIEREEEDDDGDPEKNQKAHVFKKAS